MIRNQRHRPDLFIPKPHRVAKIFCGIRPIGVYAFRVRPDSMVKVFVGLPQGMRVKKRFLPEFQIKLPNAIIKSQCKG